MNETQQPAEYTKLNVMSEMLKTWN